MTEKPDYTALDAAILNSLSERAKTFVAINAGALVKLESQKLEKTFGKGLSSDKPSWRYVDARLQSMRKSGKIEFLNAKEGWVLK